MTADFELKNKWTYLTINLHKKNINDAVYDKLNNIHKY